MTYIATSSKFIFLSGDTTALISKYDLTNYILHQVSMGVIDWNEADRLNDMIYSVNHSDILLGFELLTNLGYKPLL